MALPSFETGAAVPSAASSQRLERVLGVGAHRLVDIDAHGLKINDGKLVKKADGLSVGVYAHNIADELHRVPCQESNVGDIILLNK